MPWNTQHQAAQRLARPGAGRLSRALLVGLVLCGPPALAAGAAVAAAMKMLATAMWTPGPPQPRGHPGPQASRCAAACCLLLLLTPVHITACLCLRPLLCDGPTLKVQAAEDLPTEIEWWPCLSLVMRTNSWNPAPSAAPEGACLAAAGAAPAFAQQHH